MPIYEFNCQKCKTGFEELIFGEATPPCPECGSTQTEKLISRAAFHGRSGSGDWQPDDSRPAPAPGSGCGGCSGGSCSTCGM